jgi:hypothetical protein
MRKSGLSAMPCPSGNDRSSSLTGLHKRLLYWDKEMIAARVEKCQVAIGRRAWPL